MQEMSATEKNSSSQGKKKDRKEAVRCSLAIKSKFKFKLKTKTTKSEAMIKMQFKLKESSINEIMKNYNSRAAQILALRSIDQKGHQCKKTKAAKNYRLQD